MIREACVDARQGGFSTTKASFSKQEIKNMNTAPYKPENPLIVQSDGTVLMDLHSPDASQARERVSLFAELVKSPEHVHTYRITPLSVWNARALGVSANDMVGTLENHARYEPPSGVLANILDLADRYGRVVLERTPHGLKLTVSGEDIAQLLAREEKVARYLGNRRNKLVFEVDPAFRGVLKQALVEAGYPADDQAGYTDGDPLKIRLKSTMQNGEAFHVRDYQRQAVEAFYGAGTGLGGSGVVCLPCGAGKTIVGLGAMGRLEQTTLILTTSLTSVKQWRRELLDKTDIPGDMIAEYTGEKKDIGPVTLTTYQILTWRASADSEFRHFSLFHARPWGLIIYDEVHLLPAPVFRVTAELQARRRLGMTATLIREDGREGDVFALIGPKRYDVPWRDLEQSGWIADAACTEIRIPMSDDLRMAYALAPKRRQFRIAAENPKKHERVKQLLETHAQGRILIIGEYIDQLKALSDEFGFPLITGKTAAKKRETLYEQFRTSEIRHLILSRVGNFALDLPDADVLIQVSGIFGSRQEEAQRLGRILRPKPDGRQARFYTLVSHHTREEDFARNRQLFLAEQGYTYHLELA
jgi:DNA excision repair protein ERCC-3